MSSTFWRRFFLTVYVLAMVGVSIFIIAHVFAPGEMVQIYDQEAVMRRRTSNLLTSLTIDDPRWPQVTITDQDFLLALGQKINSIPRVSGQYPGEAPGKIAGTMFFADGDQDGFTVGTVLTVGGTVYYSPETQAELADVYTTLASRLYTLENLASFFRPDNRIMLADETSSILLSPEEMELIRQAVEAGEPVEDLAEVSQTVGGRAPRYTLTVWDAAGEELLRLWVYANESIQVFDSASPGQPLLLCFGGELVPLCRGMLGG